LNVATLIMAHAGVTTSNWDGTGILLKKHTNCGDVGVRLQQSQCAALALLYQVRARAAACRLWAAP
jgi:hypothetical protein